MHHDSHGYAHMFGFGRKVWFYEYIYKHTLIYTDVYMIFPRTATYYQRRMHVLVKQQPIF